MSQLAGLLLDRGDHKQAVEWLTKAIASDPDSSVLAAHLAEAHWRAGQADDAATAWRRAAELAPPAEQVSLAVSLMRRATEILDPANPRLRLDYAEMLVSAGAARECLDQLAAAERLNNALPAESLLRFNESEVRRLALLRAWGRTLTDSPSAQPAGTRREASNSP
jgi:tetratricopeptide (TPR) repeat protein